MAEFNKNMPGQNEADNEEPSASSADDDKNLVSTTKGIMESKSSAIMEFKKQAATAFTNVQKSYVIKEMQVHDMFKISHKPSVHNSTTEVAKEYRHILLENISKLKEIAQEDFDKSRENSKRLIEEAKNKLHHILTKAFSNQESKKEFAKTAENIFNSINQQIKEDLTTKKIKHERHRSILEPDYTNVFVNPSTKSPEEIEAEQILQKLFEEHLMEYSEQFKEDFQQTDQNISKQVEETKEKVSDKIQSLLSTELPTLDIKQSTSLPNVPTNSAVKNNINTLLKKTEDDFQKINEKMANDVSENKRKINENVKYYSEKLMGKRFFSNEED